MKHFVLLATCFVGLAAPVRASWTIAVLPDTQGYGSPTNAPGFRAQTQWIVDNKAALSIEMVLHEGDITNQNRDDQWLIAKSAMSTLNGQVPYMMALGNHDYYPLDPPFDDSERSKTLINDYFSLSDNSLNSITTEMVAGDLANTYSSFTAPDGRKTLVLSLEFLPRAEVMDWAGGIADLYADHTAIVLVHANLNEGPSVNGEPIANRHGDGELLWNGLNSQHENIEVVLSGHHLDGDDTDPNGPLTTARQSSTGINGNTVHEITFNSQEQPNGGDGYMRLLEFLDDGKTVQVRTYSPTLDRWLTNDRNEFQVELTPLFLGDFDDDGGVDGDDFLAWQQGGSPNPLSVSDLGNWESYYDIIGDNDFDGDVDGNDFLIWQRRESPNSISPSDLVDWETDYGNVGDFDLDGDTDGFDFLAWQRRESPDALSASDLADWETDYGSAGDFDLDGDTNGSDFLAWQRRESPNALSDSDRAAWEANYGTVPPISAPSTTIPEPAAGIMLTLTMTIMLFHRQTVGSWPKRRKEVIMGQYRDCSDFG